MDSRMQALEAQLALLAASFAEIKLANAAALEEKKQETISKISAGLEKAEAKGDDPKYKEIAEKLRSKLEETERNYTKLQKENEVLCRRIEELEAENLRLKGELLTATERCSSLEKIQKEQEVVIQQQNLRIQEFAASSSSMAEQIAALQAENVRLVQERDAALQETAEFALALQESNTLMSERIALNQKLLGKRSQRCGGPREEEVKQERLDEEVAGQDATISENLSEAEIEEALPQDSAAPEVPERSAFEPEEDAPMESAASEPVVVPALVVETTPADSLPAASGDFVVPAQKPLVIASRKKGVLANPELRTMQEQLRRELAEKKKAESAEIPVLNLAEIRAQHLALARFKEQQEQEKKDAAMAAALAQELATAESAVVEKKNDEEEKKEFQYEEQSSLLSPRPASLIRVPDDFVTECLLPQEEIMMQAADFLPVPAFNNSEVELDSEEVEVQLLRFDNELRNGTISTFFVDDYKTKEELMKLREEEEKRKNGIVSEIAPADIVEMILDRRLMVLDNIGRLSLTDRIMLIIFMGSRVGCYPWSLFESFMAACQTISNKDLSAGKLKALFDEWRNTVSRTLSQYYRHCKFIVPLHFVGVLDKQEGPADDSVIYTDVLSGYQLYIFESLVEFCNQITIGRSRFSGNPKDDIKKARGQLRDFFECYPHTVLLALSNYSKRRCKIVRRHIIVPENLPQVMTEYSAVLIPEDVRILQTAFGNIFVRGREGETEIFQYPCIYLETIKRTETFDMNEKLFAELDYELDLLKQTQKYAELVDKLNLDYTEYYKYKRNYAKTLIEEKTAQLKRYQQKYPADYENYKDLRSKNLARRRAEIAKLKRHFEINRRDFRDVISATTTSASGMIVPARPSNSQVSQAFALARRSNRQNQ